ncbi:MAG TPA: TonB family protein [Pyrinomonadaceae bacterium]|nr:TonB family protein [Pyrinomonadaceae bacterium]
MRCGNCGNELRGDARFCSVCGAPVPQAQPSFSAPPPAATFGDAPRQPLSGAGQPRKKSGCGKVLLVLFIIGLLVLAGLAVAGYFAYRFAEDKLKSSEAYTHAVERLKADPEVTGKMGEIRETGFPLGAFNENADGTGTAVFRMSVTGAKASGNYDVSMSRAGGRWIMHTGKVTLKSGEEIEVESDDDEAAKPPEVFEPPPPAKPGATGPGKPISGGVLNGKAISKPEPAYPAVAKAARASGTVVVQITVDESGKVASASAVSGHPLLRQAAVQAAYQAKFLPTLLSGKPVKVTGTITYNFNLPAQE